MCGGVAGAGRADMLAGGSGGRWLGGWVRMRWLGKGLIKVLKMAWQMP